MASQSFYGLRRRMPSSKFVRDFAYVSFAFVSWVPAVIFFNTHVAEITRINGASMYPYLNTTFNEELTRDLCFVQKWNALEDLQRGMIVSFRYGH